MAPAGCTATASPPGAAHCSHRACISRHRPATISAASSTRHAAASQHRRCRPRLAATAADIEGTPPPPPAEAAADGLQVAQGVVVEFCRQHELPNLGSLSIRPVRVEDVGSASVLLTRAFAGSLQGVPIHDARQYVVDCLTQPPRGMLLVARLRPDDSSLLPPGQTSRLVATTGLSFCRQTREDFPTLQPPDDAVYLSNMAVDAKLRRQGLARLMLAAAEALAASRGCSHIYLHARLADQAAQSLYLSSSYSVVDRDNSLLAKVRGITPRALMRKSLS